MLRLLAATLALFLAVPAVAAYASDWPPEVTAANNALVAAKSFRVTSTAGAMTQTVVVTSPNRDRIVLPPNAVAIREADGTDGVSAAHLYHIIYPSGSPQVRWYIRVSDGLVHKIRRPGRGVTITLAIDQYRLSSAR
jgi:hypothetical protein